jgi:branched-subunit amino acid aminotransferase/4-amino-4-deoxychorismate lyase
MPIPAYVSRNGVLIPAEQATVSVFNPAVNGAYGVYESMQVYGGAIFALKDHLGRLDHSAGLIGLPLPADLQTVARWCLEVVTASNAGECTLRLTVVGAEDGGCPTAYLWTQDSPAYPPSYYTEGVAVVTFEGQRFMPEAKSLNNLVSFLARRNAQARGAHESLLHHDGVLTEGASSNLFVVQGEVLMTPPSYQVLSGVTRDLVIRLARRNGISLLETPLARASISAWSECFITSSSRHIMPVTSVDHKPVGGGRVGPVTRRLISLFETCFRNATECAEYPL